MITPAMARYLNDIKIPIRLACVSESGWPVTLSLWYLHENGQLYCATQASALTARYLEREPRCAFEVASDTPPYCGVRGQARAAILPERGIEVLTRLLTRYLGDTDNPLAQRLLSRKAPEVAIRLDPVHVTSWDFRGRMSGSVEGTERRLPCPEG